MGRIKTKNIKSLTEEVFSKYRESFTTDFEKNKKAVSAYLDGGGKKIRNTVAGYVTRLAKTREA